MADIRRAEEGDIVDARRGQEEEDENEDNDNESNDPPLPSWLAEDVQYWHHWYVAIVHKFANVAVRRPFRYTEGYAKPSSSSSSSSFSDDDRPFPFNLEAHWYCAFVLLAIIALHIGFFETGWLLANDRLYWVGRVLGRSFLTLGIATASTFTFELGGEYASREIKAITRASREFVARVLFARLLGWGEVDEEGNPVLDEEEGGFVWLRDEAAWRAPIRELFCEIVGVYFVDYCLMLLSSFSMTLLSLLVENVLVPGLEFFFCVRGDFLMSLPSFFALPMPGIPQGSRPEALLSLLNGSLALDLSAANQILRTLWFEHGVPIVIQFILIILLWLLWFLFLAQAERWALYGWRVEDPKMALIAHLVRATSMHLIAYTAYQMVWGIIAALNIIIPPALLLQKHLYYINMNTNTALIIDGPVPPLLTKIISQGRILAAALLLFFHWFLRATSRFLVLTFAEPLFTPYLVWCTRFTEEGARSMWPALTHPLTGEMNVLDPGKRVVSRVVMTALFGLDSSWPAKYHLSNIIADD